MASPFDDGAMSPELLLRVGFDREDTIDTNVRYITRWNVQASDPTKPSPAKHPIVYTLTNTIPEQYKPAIRDALLEWNKAFEKIGILKTPVIMGPDKK